MKNILFICFSIFVISQLSFCKTQNDRKVIKIIKNDNGVVIAKIVYIISGLSDTIQSGESIYYYDNGNIKESIQYNNNLKNGWDVKYRTDGTLISKIHFKHGKQYGMTYWYYENGNTESESSWVNGQNYGLVKYYYENGNTKGINIIDYHSKALWLQEFNNRGEKIKNEGYAFSENFVFEEIDTVYIKNNKVILYNIKQADSLQKDKPIRIKTVIACIPETQPRFFVKVFDKEGNLLLGNLKFDECSIMYEIVFPEGGTYMFNIFGEILNNDGSILRIDSFKRDLYLY